MNAGALKSQKVCLNVSANLDHWPSANQARE